MKAVLICIQPKWCKLILKCIGWENQRPLYKKRLELRKTAPKPPFKAHIYCTKGKTVDELFTIATRGNNYLANGKIIGEIVCNYVLSHCEMANEDIAEQMSCVSREDILKYANGKKVLGWHIDELVIYDKPKELSEFYTECRMNCEHCEMWGYTRINAEEFDMDCKSDWYNHKPLTRPPQSWCYVDVPEGR